MDFKLSYDLEEIQALSKKLNKIQDSCPDTISTKRLILRKNKTLDWVSTVYTILLRKTEQEIGNVTLIADGEVWYKVYEPFRRRGYATEAVKGVMEVLGTNIKLYLLIDPSNKASRKVAKKLGFVCKRKIRYGNEKTMIFQKK